MTVTNAATGRRVNGKPIIDMNLAELGANLKRTTMLYNETKKQLRALELEQDKRLKELAAVQHLEVIDIGVAYQVVNPRPAPSEFQTEVLETFAAALEMDDPGFLERVYAMAIKTRCQFTNWTTEYREGVQAAYERRMSELKEIEAEAGQSA